MFLILIIFNAGIQIHFKWCTLQVQACTFQTSYPDVCCFVFFRGKNQSVLTSLSSSSFSASVLNMQQAWNVRVGFTRSNCSGSGGQGNLEELKLSRRNGTWPLRLAVRDSFWLSVKTSAFGAAQLQKLYHTLVGELHARRAALETWKQILFLTKFPSVTSPNFKYFIFNFCRI